MPRRSRRRSKPKSDWRWWLLAALAFICLCAALSAAVADIAAFRANAWVQTWRNQAQIQATALQPYQPGPADLEEAMGDAALAVRLAPYNAYYRQVLADVYISAVMSEPDGSPALAPIMESARQEYGMAIRLQPAWPYYHTAVAYTYRRQNILDARYERSLAEALRLGPWEPDVIYAIASYNLDIIPRLPPSTRKLVLDTVRRGLLWTEDSKGQPMPYGNELWKLIASRHREMVICGWMQIDTPVLRERCFPELKPAVSEPDSTKPHSTS